MTNREIFEVYVREMNARKTAGFPGPMSLAIDDTAYLLDVSIARVCEAISCEDSSDDIRQWARLKSERAENEEV